MTVYSCHQRYNSSILLENIIIQLAVCIIFLFFLSSFKYGAGISRRVKAINMLQSEHGNVCPNLILPKCFNSLGTYGIIPSMLGTNTKV